VGSFWYLLVGVLLVGIALLGRVLDKMPVSPAIIYLVVGFTLGPACFDVFELHPLRELAMLEGITEVALLIALFTVGIKLRVPIGDWRWSLPLRLATVSMVVTILGVALIASLLLGFSWGLALVLGATLAPTDPVLASEVQLRGPQDRDTLRFGLTGEGGLNDGTAFPFVMLGLGVLGLHDMGFLGLRWVAVDLIWGTVGGLGVGFAIGAGLARGVRYMRAKRGDAVSFDEFLLLGVITLSYGAALAIHALGFLAVFAAGLALRREDDIHAGSHRVADKSPLTPSMLSVNEQLERIVEVAIVLLVGAMISTGYWSQTGLVLAAILFFVIRPLSVWLGLIGYAAEGTKRRMIGWFGIRGIGSVYYAVYFAGYEIHDSVAAEFLSVVFTVIAASIVMHGVSATPLMEIYQRRRAAAQQAAVPLSDKR
jgi:NhaP-type Na+/H+ or K+/H+ antiporter